jgi:hypothetical protein
VPNGARQSGHSGFWLCQAAMQAQQNTWPHGVAAGVSRAPRHSAHLRRAGTSAHSAAAPGAPPPRSAASSVPSSCGTAGQVGKHQQGDPPLIRVSFALYSLTMWLALWSMWPRTAHCRAEVRLVSKARFPLQKGICSII